MLTTFKQTYKSNLLQHKLRVVSNFGDGDCGAGEIHTRARESSRRRVSSNFRARVCISPAPQSPSPKLETTRSLPTAGRLFEYTLRNTTDPFSHFVVASKLASRSETRLTNLS